MSREYSLDETKERKNCLEIVFWCRVLSLKQWLIILRQFSVLKKTK